MALPLGSSSFTVMIRTIVVGIFLMILGAPFLVAGTLATRSLIFDALLRSPEEKAAAQRAYHENLHRRELERQFSMLSPDQVTALTAEGGCPNATRLQELGIPARLERRICRAYRFAHPDSPGVAIGEGAGLIFGVLISAGFSVVGLVIAGSGVLRILPCFARKTTRNRGAYREGTDLDGAIASDASNAGR